MTDKQAIRSDGTLPERPHNFRKVRRLGEKHPSVSELTPERPVRWQEPKQQT
jgi:hypothetical protein